MTEPLLMLSVTPVLSYYDKIKCLLYKTSFFYKEISLQLFCLPHFNQVLIKTSENTHKMSFKIHKHYKHQKSLVSGHIFAGKYR